MAEDPFLLVSLEESESKELAKVISNKTSRKLLDFLSKKDSATETEIAHKMKIPLSTVHYNLQHLLKANLIKVDEFHYSEKGKEVNHYSLANKIIIIAPKKTSRETFMSKLKGLLPVGIIALATAGVIKMASMFKLGASRTFAAAPMAAQAADKALVKTAEVLEEEAVVSGAEVAGRGAGVVTDSVTAAANDLAANVSQNITPPVDTVTQPIIQVIQQTPEPNIALWFLLGAAFVIILLVIWYWFVTRKKKSRK